MLNGYTVGSENTSDAELMDGPPFSLSLSAQRISNCLSCKSADQLLFSSFPAEEQESDTAILRSRTSLEHVPDFLRSSEEQILGSCVVVLSLLTHGVQKSGGDSLVTANVTVLCLTLQRSVQHNIALKQLNSIYNWTPINLW